MTTYDALLVVSFGGPDEPDDVMPFLETVTCGRGVPPERLAEVARHYLDLGGVSPINAQNLALIDALGAELAEHRIDLPIYWGNRNWHPLLAETVATMAADGVRRALAFVTSAFSSYSGCRQYREDIAGARAAAGPEAPEIDKIRVFYDHPGFVEAMADRLVASVAEIEPGLPAPTVVFTAHSIPVSMAETSDYVAQLSEAAGLVVDAAGGSHDWRLAYQSRSGPPKVPWLEPDIVDVLHEIDPDRPVVVVPIGFLSDHMEVVYDLDTEARAVSEARGLRMIRVPTVGTHPRFVGCVRELVTERLDPTLPRAALGTLGVRPDDCPLDCCPAPPRPGAATPTGDDSVSP